MPRIAVPQRVLDAIHLRQGPRQTEGEALAELLDERARWADAIKAIAVALPQSATGIDFADPAIPDEAHTDDIIRYAMERAGAVVLPGQTVPSLAPYRAELTAAPKPVGPRVIGPSVWQRLRMPWPSTDPDVTDESHGDAQP